MATKEKTAQAIDELRKIFPEGSTVWTRLDHVSASGIQRVISIIALKVDEATGEPYPLYPTWLAHEAGMGTVHKKHDGLIVRGCGMDMGFHLVDCMSWKLYGEGGKLHHRWI